VGKTLTWTHVVDATSAKFITEVVSCSEAEVGLLRSEGHRGSRGCSLASSLGGKYRESGSIPLRRAAGEDVLDESIVP